MRVVLDTNVLVRAVRSESPAAEVLRQLLAAPHVLILSPFLLSELSRALRYERLRARHGLTEGGIDAYVRHVQAGSLMVTLRDQAVKEVVFGDPDDDPVIATAVVGRADVLCTLDRHFR